MHYSLNMNAQLASGARGLSLVRSFILLVSCDKYHSLMKLFIYAEPKRMEPYHFEVFFYFTHKRYGFQVNIRCDLHNLQ